MLKNCSSSAGHLRLATEVSQFLQTRMLTFSSLEGKKRGSQPGKKTVNFSLHTKCLHYKKKIPRCKTAKMLTVGSVHFMNQLHQMFWHHGFFSANTGNPKETNQIVSFVVFVTFSGAELKRQNSELCNQTSGFVHIYSEAGKRGFQVQVQTWEKGNTRSHSTMYSPSPDGRLSLTVNWEGSRKDRFRSQKVYTREMETDVRETLRSTGRTTRD